MTIVAACLINLPKKDIRRCCWVYYGLKVKVWGHVNGEQISSAPDMDVWFYVCYEERMTQVLPGAPN